MQLAHFVQHQIQSVFGGAGQLVIIALALVGFDQHLVQQGNHKQPALGAALVFAAIQFGIFEIGQDGVEHLAAVARREPAEMMLQFVAAAAAFGLPCHHRQPGGGLRFAVQPPDHAHQFVIGGLMRQLAEGVDKEALHVAVAPVVDFL